MKSRERLLQQDLERATSAYREVKRSLDRTKRLLEQARDAIDDLLKSFEEDDDDGS